MFIKIRGKFNVQHIWHWQLSMVRDIIPQNSISGFFHWWDWLNLRCIWRSVIEYWASALYYFDFTLRFRSLMLLLWSYVCLKFNKSKPLSLRIIIAYRGLGCFWRICKPIKIERGRGSIWHHPVVFPKIYLLKRGWNLVFCDFWYYHKSHLSWKFHWISSICSEDMKNFFVNISYFHHFHQFFGFFWHFLVMKKLMTSAYNRWCPHFFIFNLL